MKVDYTRGQGLRRTYTIEVDRRGGYVVRLGDKVLKAAPAQDGFGNRYGSKKLEAQGLRAAEAAIEMLMGMDEE